MANFRINLEAATDMDGWLSLYPNWCHGAAEWREQSILMSGMFSKTAEWNKPSLPAPGNLYARASKGSEKVKPRVFISHRQGDERLAEYVKDVAVKNGFNYWLDVVNLPPPSVIKNYSAASIALRIEMGLLNCSHLVAVYTDNAQGSSWVPYEFGRVKEPVLASTKCCTFIQTISVNSYIPEWTKLNVECFDSSSLENWFRRERNTWAP